MVEELIEELNRLKEAERLLRDLWLDIGPYNIREGQMISEDLMNRLNDYMRFDDSE